MPGAKNKQEDELVSTVEDAEELLNVLAVLILLVIVVVETCGGSCDTTTEERQRNTSELMLSGSISKLIGENPHFF